MYSAKAIYCYLEAEKLITGKTDVFSMVQKLSVTNDRIKIEFLSYLYASPTVLPKELLRILQYAFLHDQHICELRFLWLRLCIKSRWLEMARHALEFACEYCTPKYACPIFHDLYEWTVTRDLAVKWFKEKHLGMLPETIKQLEYILKVNVDVTK